jgi:hypothetical protein
MNNNITVTVSESGMWVFIEAPSIAFGLLAQDAIALHKALGNVLPEVAQRVEADE